jgi:hypothetical protein
MKMQLQPRLSVPGIPGFLLWARRDNPALYAALVSQFPEVAEFDSALKVEGLGGLADILKGVGSALSSSAKKIGSFVVNYALPVASVAVPLVVAKKQADVAIAQMRVADAQQPPMQTALLPGQSPGWPQAVPVQQVGGQWQQVPVGSVMAAATPLSSPVLGVPLWGWIAGAGALGLVWWMRRR